LSRAGFVSGHAYGKALRTVKTCVGSEWCRFGTQDSTGMGVRLEKMSWGAWTPHKFKMAASGCPRNCAEATIKDFGVVCVDSGYELHVGGNGGVKVRATDLLCHVDTAEQVLEYCSAFMQLYREEAHYLERTAPWIERVGLSVDADQYKYPHELSGGMKRRLTLARALSHEPEVLCLDEFSIAIDPVTTMRIEDILRELKEELTIVLVTNLVQQARRLADRTMFLFNGEVVELGPSSVVFSDQPANRRTFDYVHGVFG